MGKAIQAKRDNAIAMVKAGTWAAQDTYKNRDGMGAYTKGMLEPYEAQAKASGLGIWANASQADRSSAASYRAPVKVAAKSDQRAAALGVDPRAYAASGGKLLPPSISSTPSFSSTPRRSLQVMPGGSPYEDPANKEKQSRLDTLRGYAEEFKGTDAEAGYRRGIDQLSRELEEAYKPRPSVTPQGYSASDTSWGQDYGPTPGEAAIADRQRTATTPAASMNGEGNNNVGKLTPPLPTKSNYADVPNRFDETYTGRLLAQARGQAEQEAALGARRLRESMAERGLTQNGMSGLEAQGLREIEMNRQNNLGNMSRDAQVQSAQLASGFDMQRAGALDAFDMNVGNLSLGYSADARAGMLINGQVEAQQLSNQGQGYQNQFSEATMGDRIAGVTADLYSRNLENQYGAATLDDRIQAVRSEVNAAGIRNDRAMFELNQARQVAPLQQQAAALELIKLQQAITLARQTGDIQMAEGLGKVAGKIAAGGGFKWIGTGIGAFIGSAGPQALLGGTLAGAGAGGTIGDFLDRMLAPQQASAGK